MSLELSLTLVAVFASVALIAATFTAAALTWASPARRQVRRLSRQSADTDSVLVHLQIADAPEPWILRFQQILPRSPQEMSRLRRRLAAAGHRTLAAATLYGASEVVLPVVVGLAMLVLAGPARWYLALLAAVFGFLLPSVWLGRRTAERQREIRHGLPDALDLMIVCIEAGSSIDQAILKTSDELDIAHPTLADELRILTAQLRAGRPRLEAFRDLAARTRVDEVRSLVSMLVQTDRFGTSIAQALRTHADVLRTRRRQAAEERAAKMGVKLVFPLVFCLFPALYVAILGPAIIQYVRHFGTETIEVPRR